MTISQQMIGTNIKRLRGVAGLSQDEAAIKSGITRLAYLNIENGKAQPRTSTLMAIAQALNSNVSEFLVVPQNIQSLRFRINKTITQKEKNLRDLEIAKTGQWLKK